MLLGLPAIVHAQGFITPDDIANRIALQNEAADKHSSVIVGFGGAPTGPTPLFPCSADATSFNLRQLGAVADPPGDQTVPVKDCNSCWAFAAGSAIETSYYYFNGTSIDTSKQQLLNCSISAPRPTDQLNVPGLYTCRGGGYFDAPFNLGETPAGVLPTADYRTVDNRTGYLGVDLQCRSSGLSGTAHHVTTWKPISPDPKVVASTRAIKESLCRYGGVVTGIDHSSWPGPDKPQRALQVGKRTPLDPDEIKRMTHHAVQIVGWNDLESWSDPVAGQSGKGVWIIKNSWGAWSGDRGYLHIPYDHQAVGYLAAWVSADLGVTLNQIPAAHQADFLTTLDLLRAVKRSTNNPQVLRQQFNAIKAR